MAERSDGDAGMSRMKRRRPPWWAVALAVVAIACAAHWWPGRGLLTYFGFQMHPENLDLHGPGEWALASPDPSVSFVENFAIISPALYRGAQPDEQGFAALKRLGIKTIVNLRELHGDREEMAGLALQYARLRFNPTEPSDELVAQFLSILRDPSNCPVYVHCQMGSDRTGIMVAAYRVIEEGWPVEEAAKELPRFGFHESWTDLLRYLSELNPQSIEDLIRSGPAPEIETVP